MPSIPPYPQIHPYHSVLLRQRAQHIQVVIKRGEIWIQHACAQRARLLRRRNHLKATTKDLPIEILSLIFRHATSTHASSIPQYRMTFRIAHVCSHWRDVVWSTPQMWTAFQIPHNWQDDLPVFVEFLRLYFTNIGNLQLSLNFYLCLSPHHADLTDVDQVLLSRENAIKVHSFALYQPSARLFFPSAFAFPNLEDLTLTTIAGDREIDLSALPKLKSLTLRGSMPNVLIPSSQLTKLCLVDIEQNMCANLLKKCPYLKEFANIYYTTFSQHQAIELESWDTDLSFRFLEIFTWSCLPHPSSEIVLSRIRLPAAKVVRWIHDNSVPVEDVNQIARIFFSNLPKTVTTLAFERLSMRGFPVSLFKYIFAKHTQVNEVVYQECTVSSAVDFFSVLVPLRTLANQNDGTMYLPSLHTLTLVKGWHFDEEFEGPLIRSLARAQIQRYLFGIISPQRLWGPNSHFRFNLNDITEVYLEHSEEHCRVMREMRRNGTNLEIFVNGEELAW